MMPPDVESSRYAAFISYRHVEPDRAWARWLHAALETYRVPRSLVHAGIPPRVGRVFRDEEELSASSDLSGSIEEALEQSRFLIVVCSPRTPASRWVNEEVERFRAMGRGDRILSLLVEGEPGASFPPSLVEIRRPLVEEGGGGVGEGGITAAERARAVEPLAADIRTSAGRSDRQAKRTALLRLAATVLGCRFDDLRRREQERLIRRLVVTLGVLAGLVVFSASMALIAYFQRLAADQRQIEAEIAGRQEREARHEEEVQRVEAQRQTALALERLERSRRGVNALQLERAAALWDRDPAQGLALLEDVAQCPLDLRDFTWRHLHRLCRREARPIDATGHHPEAVAFSGDGRILASVGGYRSIRLWEPATGRPVGSLPEQGGAEEEELGEVETPCLALSADGSVLVSGTSGGTVRFWDVPGRRLLGEVEAHGHRVEGVAISPDGKQAASGSLDRTVILWDVATRRERARLGDLGGMVYSVAISPDGETMAVGTEPDRAGDVGGVRLIDLETLETGRVLEIAGTVSSLAFSADGRSLAAAALSVLVWDVESGAERADLGGNGLNAIHSVAFLPDGKTVAASGPLDAIRLWDVEARRETLVLELGPLMERSELAISPDGSMLASAGGDLRLWDLAGPERLVGIEGPVGTWSATLSEDGERFAVGLFDGSIEVGWVERDGPRLRLRGHQGPVQALAFSPDGTTLASSGDAEAPTAHEIILWDLASGEKAATIDAGPQAWSLAFAPDGRTLVTEFAAFDVVRGVRARDLPHRFDSIDGAAAFSRDGTLLAVSHSSGTVTVFDSATWETVAEFRDDTGVVGVAVCFSPDGSTLVSSHHNWALIWDLGDRRERGRLAGARGTIREIRFTADGKTLATLDDESIRLWDPLVGQQRARIAGSHSTFRFSPDGRRLVAVRPWERSATDAVPIQVSTREASPAGALDSITLRRQARAVAFAPSLVGDRLYAGEGKWDFGNKLRVWDSRTGESLAMLEGHPWAISDLDVSADGRILASASSRPEGSMIPQLTGGAIPGEVHIWDAATGGPIAHASFPDLGLTSVALSADGTRLVVAGGSDLDTPSFASVTPGKLMLFRVDGASLKPVGERDFPGPIGPMAAAPDLSTIAVAEPGGIIALREPSALRRVGRLEGHEGNVRGLAYSPDGRSLASAGDDGTVRIWDLAEGRPRLTLGGRGGEARAVAFDRTGSRIASGDAEGAILIRAVATGEVLRQFPSRGIVHSVAFSPDGRHLVAAVEGGGEEGRVRFFELEAPGRP